jgi:VNT family MFS transporter (synaptic vesicle glycoprotein 2)
MAVTLAAGRLGAILANVVFGYFITVTCAIPILSVAAFLISGGLVGLLLPNTTNTSLD